MREGNKTLVPRGRRRRTEFQEKEKRRSKCNKLLGPKGPAKNGEVTLMRPIHGNL